MTSYEGWTVRKHQNQKYVYDHGALDLIGFIGQFLSITPISAWVSVRFPDYNRHSTRSRPLLLRTCQTADSDITTSDLANDASCCLALTCRVIAKIYIYN